MPVRQKPNSMLEWVAGRNITPRQRNTSQPRGVLKLQVFTDDAAETDTLAVTYPRSGSHRNVTPRTSASKQVKFSDGSQQALVKHRPIQQPVEQPIESDLEVETSGSEESTEVIHVIKRKKRAKHISPPATPPQGVPCLKDLPVPSAASDDNDEDITPHPLCPCAKCVYGRKLLKKANKKRKAKREIEGDENTNATDRAQAVALGGSPNKSNSKKARVPKAYPPPEIRNPNLIVPSRAEVLHIEHAVETPEDPRPNAFVDNEHGICRIYHGPAYGNPYGSLYPRRGLSGPPPFQPLPAGVPHPTQNPYYNSFDPNQMARHGQPPPPSFQPWTGYVPPPPPAAGYPPGPPPEITYPMHMPWYNYQVPPEGHKGHKKVPSPVMPPVVPSVPVPPAMPYVIPPATPPAAEPPKAAPADVTMPQKPNDRPSSGVAPPFGLLTPRAIAAKFSDNPVSNVSGKDKDKDKGWDSNVAPKPPSHKDGSHHSGSKGGGWGGSGWGGGGDGWGGGGGSDHASNNNNGWGSGLPTHNSPRASNKDINGGNKGGSGNGWGGSRHNNSPKNDGWGGGWGGGSQRSGSKKSSNHSRNSANQRAADIGGDGWGGGWDTASMQNQAKGNGNGNGWGGGSPRRSNNGGHNAFNSSPRVSNRGNNDGWGGSGNNDGWGGAASAKNSPPVTNNVAPNHGNGWGPSGSNHGSNRGSAKGSNNGWGNGGGDDTKHRSGRHSNSPPSGGRHASNSGNHHHSPHDEAGRHRSSSRMPGSWESVPSNNAGPQGTPGGRSRVPSSPLRSGSNRSKGRSQTGWGGGEGSPRVGNSAPQGGAGGFGAFEGMWNSGSVGGGGGKGGGGGGGGPSWADPTAAQSTQPLGGW
ncbi:hypothetical protein BR93DRAFT_398719 [Coniochaeta sp. PMI_546]|nr:hypothetical protein BR93DRAFT_398719 [Coniochaeta sp. PMI_546]